MDNVGLDLLCTAYENNFDDLQQKRDTEIFLQSEVYSQTNVMTYLKITASKLIERARNVTLYNEWFAIAEEEPDLVLIFSVEVRI